MKKNAIPIDYTWVYETLPKLPEYERFINFVNEMAPEQEYLSVLNGIVSKENKINKDLSKKKYAAIYQVLANCIQTLGLKKPVYLKHILTIDEAFIEDAPINLDTVSDDTGIIIRLSDRYINTFDDPEYLRCSLGHELGHYMFDPVDVDRRRLQYFLIDVYGSDSGQTRKKKRIIDKYMAKDEDFYRIQLFMDLLSFVSQIQEINADRASIICTNSYKKAIDFYVDCDVREEKTTSTKLRKEIDGVLSAVNYEFPLNDIMLLCPSTPVRCACIALFAETTLAGGKRNVSDVNREILNKYTGVLTILDEIKRIGGPDIIIK